MSAIKKYLDIHKERFIEELLSFLRIPSVGAIKSYKVAVEKAADFLKEAFLKAGVDKACLLPTAGHPIVYAEKIIDPSLPTMLVYGHYDVQPADPEELWITPAFEPDIRDGNIYARGACDDKGQVYLHVKALEAMNATDTLCCNLKFLIEGEEEVGSPNVTSFIKDPANAALLKCDVIVVSDMPMPTMEQPVIAISLRGIVMLKITVEGPNRDLHSGTYGGAVMNPIHGLVSLLAALKDETHSVTIPSFYADVEEHSATDRKLLNELPFDKEAYEKDLGIDKVVGEKGYTTLERTGIRPTLEINGIWGGAKEPKTVLPAKAHAIISMRLVANQDYKKILQDCQAHLEALAAKLPALEGTHIHIEAMPGGSSAFATPTDSKSIRAVRKAFEGIWGGHTPLLVREGGSIPLLTTMQQHVSKEFAMLSFGLDNDNIHSPNEKFGVQNYLKGIETVCAFYEAYQQI